MTLTILMCILFFFGYLALRRHGQALAFLAIGAGLQVLTYVVPAPDDVAYDASSFDTFVLVSLASGLGYVAWRVTRKWLDEGLLCKKRLGVFLGLGANGLIAAFILWQTGVIALA